MTTTAAAPERASKPVNRVTYPISPDYVKSWDATRAIAELISNALDEDAAPTVEWADGVLTIEDAGPGIPEYGLILGRSEKTAKQRGQFGEGKKISALVLARTRAIGRIRFETVGYALEPKIVKENLLGNGGAKHEMLAYDIFECGRTRGTKITIECKQETAQKAINRFLPLIEPGYQEPASPGRVLIDPVQKGNVYVGGVFVQHNKEFSFGYDLPLSDAKTLQNRDRTVIEGRELHRLIHQVLESCTDVNVLEVLVRRVLDGTLKDAERAFPWQPTPAYRKAMKQVAGRVIGDGKMVAYKTWRTEAKALLSLQHAQKYEVMEPKVDAHIFETVMKLMGVPSVEQVYKEPRRQPREITTWAKPSELTPEQTATLDRAVQAVRALYGANAVGPVKIYHETRFEGADDEIACGGFYQPSGKGLIAIQIANLDSFADTLQVMVHEAAHRLRHRAGHYDYDDYSRGFEEQLETMATKALLRLIEVGGLPSADETNTVVAKQASTPGKQMQALVRDRMKVCGFASWKELRDEAGIGETAMKSIRGSASADPRRRRDSAPRPCDVDAVCRLLGIDTAACWLALFSETIGVQSRNKSGALYGYGTNNPKGRPAQMLEMIALLRASDPELADELMKQVTGEVETELDGEGHYRWQRVLTGDEEWLGPYRKLVERETARLGN